MVDLFRGLESQENYETVKRVARPVQLEAKHLRRQGIGCLISCALVAVYLFVHLLI